MSLQSSAVVSNPILKEIYTSGRVYDPSGEALECNSHTPLEYMVALYRTVLAARPRVVLEIGMAYGISSLAILMALDKIGEAGCLISVDPHQSGDWKNIGVANVQRSGFTERHELLESYDYLALPQLLESGTQIDLAYIDGWHTFDYVLLDLFYLDKMLHPGGIMGFNDCGYRAIDKAINFLLTHRKFREIDVKLKPDYSGRSTLNSTLRRIARVSHTDRYFRKTQDWEPDWNFYVRF